MYSITLWKFVVIILWSFCQVCKPVLLAFSELHCIQTNLVFCFFHRRNRAIQPGETPYSVVKDSIAFTDSSISANILNKKTNVELSLKLEALEENTARVRINEVKPIRPRYEVKDVLVQDPWPVRFVLLCLYAGFNFNGDPLAPGQ